MADKLELELKRLIIKTLDLEDIQPDDIDSEEPLFGDGLGLDSIDALEFGVMLQKTYYVKIKATSEDTKQQFACIKNLAAFIRSANSV